MNRLNYSNMIYQQAREEVRLRRLPWLCPACGARNGHSGAHWHKSGETMCNTLSVWASDLPEPK